MSKAVIRLSSVTYAIRAQRLLEQRGIRSYVKRVTSDINVHGCGYGLEIHGDVQTAQRIIGDAGIRIVSVSSAA